MTPVVLFTRADSNYRLLGVDCYDVERDARTYRGCQPVVAHPPCRAWGALRSFVKPRPDEKDLAFFAVETVRRCGGVLEHPAFSTLWPTAGLPRPGIGHVDSYGGWTLHIDQCWWGHRAQKRTWLYIVGCLPRDVPSLPLRLGEATHVVSWYSGTPKHRRRPRITKAEREHTPIRLAEWLVALASRCRPQRLPSVEQLCAAAAV